MAYAKQSTGIKSKAKNTSKALATYTEDNTISYVNTAYATYQSTPIILIGTVKKPESKMSPMEKMQQIQAGISKKALEQFKNRASLDYDKLAKLLAVTRVTLINKPTAEKFNTVLSERILALADIYSYGYDVFEDEQKFNQWMFTENKALAGKTPFEVCNNQFGREEVKNIIGRIEYGVYS
ncbi:MAG: type II toxin-antitoxin system Xre/ParS family antitoxin [Chitinophagaceae bacterium]